MRLKFTYAWLPVARAYINGTFAGTVSVQKTWWLKRTGWGITSLLLLILFGVTGLGATSAYAEGSRDLYPQSSPPTCGPNSSGGSCRANIEWRPNDVYGPSGSSIKRRTLLQVFVRPGENILVGSSAVGIGGGDALIYPASAVSGVVGNESLGTPVRDCVVDQPKTGQITSRTQELAGPQSVDGTANTTGYTPCYYTIPNTVSANGAIYYIAFYGPDGASPPANDNATIVGDISLSNPNDFNIQQKSSIAAWDVTVRPSAASSTADQKGRLFTDYLTAFTGNNGRPINFTLLPVSPDGFRYSTKTNGLDPNGFALYGNQVGFYDSDGKTPLYHDLASDAVPASDSSTDNLLQGALGGIGLAPPSFPLFFNSPTDNGVLTIQGIPISPVAPQVSNLTFVGNTVTNNSTVGGGGTFYYTGNVSGVYELTISRDGINFDPNSPANRVLRGVRPAGNQSFVWDGKANDGTNFPPGINYKATLRLHAGEYHFPLLDAENSTLGGPNFSLLNPPTTCVNNNCNTAFYDDRGYRTLNGTTVGTVNVVLAGQNPPAVAFSDPVNGFNSQSNQRAFGGDISGNGAPFQGPFGDKKGLDIWSYLPSAAIVTTLNIIAPDLAISKTNSGGSNFTVGQAITYNLVVTSSATGGPVPTGSSITVTDTIPAGLSNLTATGTGWTCNLAATTSPTTVICTYNAAGLPVAPGSTLAPIIVTGVITVAAVPAITNTGVVGTPGDTNSTNNSSSDTVTVANPPDLAILKSVTGGSTSFSVGQSVSYSLVVTSAATGGPVIAPNPIVVTDTIPAGFSNLTASGSTWNCTLAATSSPTTVVCNYTGTFPVAPGTTLPTITVSGVLTSAAATSVTNTATVSTLGDTNSGNNTSTATITVVTTVTPTVTPTTTTSTPVKTTVSTPAPTRTPVPTSTPTPTTATPTTPPTTSSTPATVTPTTPPTTSSTPATPTPTIPDPKISKTSSSSVATPGQALDFTITVANPASIAATDVVVVDNVPSVFSVQNATSSLGTVSISGQTVTINIGTLSAGATVTIHVSVVISQNAPLGTYTNSAVMTGNINGHPIGGGASNTVGNGGTPTVTTGTSTPTPTNNGGTPGGTTGGGSSTPNTPGVTSTTTVNVIGQMPNTGMAAVEKGNHALSDDTSGGQNWWSLFTWLILAGLIGLGSRWLFKIRPVLKVTRSNYGLISAAMLIILGATLSLQVANAQDPSDSQTDGTNTYTVRPDVSDMDMFGKQLSTQQVNPGLPNLWSRGFSAGDNAAATTNRLRIPAIGVDAYIETVGIRNGRIDVPDNIWDAAWFNGSAKPGEIGNAVIDGHKDWVRGTAVFWDLGKLKAGDKIYVSNENGNELTFQITDVQSYANDNLPLDQIFGPTENADLNLITCDGTFVRQQHTYNQRLVVFSQLVASN